MATASNTSSESRPTPVQGLEDRLLCEFCKSLLQPPVLAASCGHRFCNECHPRVFVNGQTTYPGEDEECKTTFREKLSPDPSMDRTLRELPMRCPFYEKGCDSEPQWHKLEKHQTTCYFRSLPSQVQQNRLDIDKLTGEQTKFKDDFDRLQRQYEELDKKQSNTYGMVSSLKNRVDTNEKITQEHRRMIGNQTNKIHEINSELKDHGKDLKHVQRQSSENKEELERHDSQANMRDNQLNRLSNTAKAHGNILVSQGNALNDHESQIESLKGARDNQECTMSVLEEKQKQQGVVLVDQRNTLADVKNQLDHAEHFASETRDSQSRTFKNIEDQFSTMNENQQTFERQISGEITDIHNRLQSLEEHSCISEYIWEIDKYIGKRDNSLTSSTQDCITSPEFYIQGYKMCLCIYLNGFNEGTRGYVSVFFKIVQGVKDESINWPFHKQVSIELVDQSIKKSNLLKSTTSVLSKCTSGVDVHFREGFPMFVKRNIVESPAFLKDDKIIIQIKIKNPQQHIAS